MEMEFVNNIDVMSREMYVKEEGKIEGKKETALEMLKKGLNINLISEITNLSVNEIKELK